LIQSAFGIDIDAGAKLIVSDEIIQGNCCVAAARNKHQGNKQSDARRFASNKSP
jgi:hypothetical protein